AFQVSQYGFSYHKSQHWTWFYRWIYGTADAPVTSSTQIRNYQPGRYGLFRTLVGDDSQGAADFFENTLLIKNIIEEHFFNDDAGEAENIDFSVYPIDPDYYGESENGGKRQIKILLPVLIIAVSASLLLLLIFIKKSKRK
ncbi:MAG: hypothetical protein FWC17_01805, partial [Treponema sp.]|nr:hypothetical protein [Treponema sp.]